MAIKSSSPGSANGRFWTHLAENGTSIAFQNRKFKGNLHPTKGDSEPRQTENLSDIFSIPRNSLHMAISISGGKSIQRPQPAKRDLWGEMCNLGRGSKIGPRPLCLGETTHYPKEENRTADGR